MTPRILAVSALAASALLAGCGKQGDLERPAPLFGQAAKAEYEKSKAAEAGDLPDGNARPNASGQDNAGDDTDVVAPPADDPVTTPLPPRTAPITGQSPNPFGVSPGGALPNPYANPNESR